MTQQSGAVEACWAHNPEVRGSKPRSAIFFLCAECYKSHVFMYFFFNILMPVDPQ